MKIRPAPRLPALDTVGYLTPHSDVLWAHGYRTAFRYLRRDPVVRDTPDKSGDWLISLTKQELDELLEKGWNVGLVQIGIGKSPDRDGFAGARVGLAAAKNAEELGAPKDTIIYCDCEWAKAPEVRYIIDYIESWGSAVVSYGYRAGLYVSTDLSVLGADGLYHLRHIKGYWKSASLVPHVTTRGYHLIQGCQMDLLSSGDLVPCPDWTERKGLLVDANMPCYDGQHSRPMVLCA